MGTAGFINLKGDVRDYTRFFLRRNPFPSLPIPQGVPEITSDREAAIKRFQDEISEMRTNHSSSVTVIVGEYGSGKSHLFRIFKQNVNFQLLTEQDATLAVYVKTPGNDFSYLFAGFIDDIGEASLSKYATQVIGKYFREHQQEVTNLIHSQGALQSFVAGKMDIEELLSGSSFATINRRIRDQVFGSVPGDDLVFAFLALPHPVYGPKAWKWISGGKVDSSELEVINVSQDVNDPEVAVRMFRDLREILKTVGIRSLVILIDELEKITYLTPTPRQNYQDVLRDWIDSCDSDTCFYFAIAPHQWNKLVGEPTALVRRLTGNWYVLGDFKEPQTKELVEAYLASNRTEPFEAKQAKKEFPDCDPELCPFLAETIPTLAEKSKGVISRILLISRRCLEHLHDEAERYRVITSELVARVSEEEGFDELE